jgi:DNA-binding response OmpR family regulator
VVRILFVDNHPEFTEVVIRQFLGSHEVTVVPTLAGAKRALATAEYDVALVDYDLDDGKGDELVRWLHAEGLRVPTIAVSARSEGNDALLAAGVRAVCPKIAFSGIGATIATVKTS